MTIYQAIRTRYLGPTNQRGSRVCATAQAGRMFVPWDHALDVAENHEKAALAFARKWDWGDRWIGGALPDGSYCFVRCPAGEP